jgi:hypothetical protein
MRLVLFAVALVIPSVASADDAVTASSVPPPAAGFPLRRIDRPRTLPEGALQASLALTGDKEAALVSRADLIYTPIDKLEARLSYAPQVTDARDFAKPIVVGARYNTYKKPSHLFVATQLDVPIATSGDALTTATLGVPTKIKLDRTFALYCGDRLLKADWANDLAFTLNAPLDIGVQLEDHTFVQLGTTLATAPLNDSMAKATTIVDKTPVLLSTYFSPDRRVDVGAQIGFTDAQEATRSLVVAINLAFRAGL